MPLRNVRALMLVAVFVSPLGCGSEQLFRTGEEADGSVPPSSRLDAGFPSDRRVIKWFSVPANGAVTRSSSPPPQGTTVHLRLAPPVPGGDSSSPEHRVRLGGPR